MDERNLIKLRSGALYGNTVYHLLDSCKHCPHFDETFKCDKELIGHHCDCDCPDCSPESYVDHEDFYTDDTDNITKVYDNPRNDLKLDELLGK